MVAEAIRRVGVVRSGLLCLLCFLSAPLHPDGGAADVNVSGFWRVAVPVVDQQASSRQAAEREAFARLLVRVTGRETVLDQYALRVALNTPQRYYMASGYELRDDAEGRSWLLTLEFDARSVTELLGAAGIPVWTTRRPACLAWVLVEDEQGQRHLASAGDEVGKALLERAERRGLEIVLPTLSRAELAAFPWGDAWFSHSDVIAHASHRYGSQSFVTMRLFQNPLGGWIADWRGEIAGEMTRGAFEVQDPVTGARTMLDALADALADRFAISIDAVGAGNLWLQVDQVATMEAYAGLMRYLVSMDGAVDVQLARIQGSSLLLRVEVGDSAGRFIDLLRLEARLLLADAPERAGNVVIWRSRWLGSSR